MEVGTGSGGYSLEDTGGGCIICAICSATQLEYSLKPLALLIIARDIVMKVKEGGGLISFLLIKPFTKSHIFLLLSESFVDFSVEIFSFAFLISYEYLKIF